MNSRIKITKVNVDAALPRTERYILWDTMLPGFGLRITPAGLKTFVLRYRARHKYAQKQFITLGRLGAITPDEARRRAQAILGQVAAGKDPAAKAAQDKLSAITLADACDKFMNLHVRPKRKPNTVALYGHAIENKIKPALGHRNMLKLSKMDVAQFHDSMKSTPVMANRVLAALAAVYSWAAKSGLIDEGFNPATRLEKFREVPKERYLSTEELRRLGHALTEAETIGFDYSYNPERPNSKHGAKPGERQAVHSPFAVAAIRLLVLTGCRVNEILGLRWSEVDFERQMLHLPDSKTGRKIVLLGDAALAILHALPRVGPYVVVGNDSQGRRTDLKRPWNAIRDKAKLNDVRLHDLRHTFASFGVGAGLGLPVITKLLGHTQIKTTQRYAHLADDPTKRAAQLISDHLASAIGNLGAKRCNDDDKAWEE